VIAEGAPGKCHLQQPELLSVVPAGRSGLGRLDAERAYELTAIRGNESEKVCDSFVGIVGGFS
jgi:hypothetical protein